MVVKQIKQLIDILDEVMSRLRRRYKTEQVVFKHLSKSEGENERTD